MKKTNETMINGLDIQIIPDETCYCKVLDEENLLKRLSVLIHWPFQYLHVGDYFEHSRGFCKVSMKVVQELFWASRGTLRELAIKFATSSPEFFNNPGSLQRWTTGGDNIIKKRVYTFPMLKSVEFLPGYFPSNSYFYSFVVQSAPNLTEIKGEWANLGSVKFWNERPIRRLKCIAIEPKQMVGRGEYVDCTDYDTLKKYSGIEPSLHGLMIRDDGDCEEVPFPSSWFDPLTQIFRSSRDTLTQLRCCSSELMKFIENEDRSSIDTSPCFPFLTILHLAMPRPYYCCGKRADRSVLRRLRIGTNFPKLVELQVDLGGCQHQLEGEEYYERDSEECPVSGFSGALEIATWWPEPEPLDYFVKTFPLLTTLSIHSVFTLFDDDEHAYTLSTIFTSFQHLKTLKLAIRWGSHFHDDIPLFSLDAILCGINFEEAEQLRTDCQNNGLKLENIEVVPVRPGLTSAASKSVTFFCKCYFKS